MVFALAGDSTITNDRATRYHPLFLILFRCGPPVFKIVTGHFLHPGKNPAALHGIKNGLYHPVCDQNQTDLV